MKVIIVALVTLAFSGVATAQPGKPCNGDADSQPGIYTDHTNPKYPSGLKGTVKEKPYMLSKLIAIEKLEEASRKDFQLTGCVARVSFGNFTPMKNHTAYGYQLGVYQNVCNINEHIVKTVDEYYTVFRVNINAAPVSGMISPISMGIGNFSIDKSRASSQYEIQIDAVNGPNYSKDAASNPSRVSTYVSEKMLLTGRSDNYKDYHSDFVKLNTGVGYVENWQGGDRYATHTEKSSQFIDRHYMFIKPGQPLLLPVSRKQYLEDMLQYLEIEKANFKYASDDMVKKLSSTSSDFAKQRLAVVQADKDAYPQIYEAKKEKIKQLLSTQSAEWLQEQAIIGNDNNSYDANDRLKQLGKFYDKEGEYRVALYTMNPEYLKPNPTQPAKPSLIEVQFRYQIAADRGFSQRLFNNFLKNFDLSALQKMVE